MTTPSPRGPNDLPDSVARTANGLGPGELYRLLHDGTPGDVEFYLGACRGATNVLELGAGWGRMALPLARAGHRVVAVDLDPTHLERATAAWQLQASSPGGELEVHAGDLLELSLPDRFERVLLPYNVLYALGGERAVSRAFEIAHRHLAPEGEIWFDVYNLDAFDAAARDGSAPGSDDDRDLVARPSWLGATLDVFERTALDLAERRLDVVYEAERDGVVVASERLTHHYLLTARLEACMVQAGLELAASWGGFDGQPFDEDAEHFVGCAVPATT